MNEAENTGWIATLKRGQTYVLRGEFFQNGKPKPVDDETKAHLEEHAVDEVSLDGHRDEDGEIEVQRLAKFEFRRPGEAATPKPRSRRKPARESED